MATLYPLPDRSNPDCPIAGEGTQNGMDVVRILQTDHGAAEDLIESIKQHDGDERAGHIEALSVAINRHMELEETVLYPVVKELLGEEAVQESNTEHELARRALSDVLRLAPDEPGFGAALAALAASLSHHIEEEESEVFPNLQRNADAMAAISGPFLHKRLELGMEASASALASRYTKEELLQEAASTGVESFASMSEHELAEALVGRTPTYDP